MLKKQLTLSLLIQQSILLLENLFIRMKCFFLIGKEKYYYSYLEINIAESLIWEMII